MRKIIALLITSIYSLLPNNSFAQNDSIVAKPTPKAMLCEIKMHDGSLYKGFIEKQNDSLLFLKSSAGVLIHVPKKQINSIDFINGHSTKDSTGNMLIHIPNIAYNYYVVSSNAFLLKKGEVYGSSNGFIFNNNINYAINQNFSLGISASVLAAPISLHAKANFEVSRKLYIGFDGLFGSGSWLNSKAFGGGGIMKLTYGDVKDNFTVSAGYGDIDYYVKAQRRRKGGGFRRSAYYDNIYSAMVGAAMSYAISSKIHFVAEIMAIPNVVDYNTSNYNTQQIGIYTFSPAIRTAIKQNISWVFGIDGVFYTSSNKGTTNNTAFAIPYIGFSFRL